MLMEFDLSNADQRIIAALSGDPEYAKRFLPGVDGHEINGRIMFGDELYDSDPKHYRNESKAPGHAWTYGGGAKKLAWTTGLPIETTQRFVDGMARAYPVLTGWQLDIRRDAEKEGFTVNRWGRKMVVDKDRSWTQTPCAARSVRHDRGAEGRPHPHARARTSVSSTGWSARCMML
jgi:DNA polymerase I-like protein with 3'-5' exonuclease and polymerase domains